jgi:hypothetical protein
MNATIAILLICLIEVYTGSEIRRTMMTGVARWHGGEATREYSHVRYWRCVCEAWFTLVLSFVIAIAVTVAGFL